MPERWDDYVQPPMVPLWEGGQIFFVKKKIFYIETAQKTQLLKIIFVEVLTNQKYQSIFVSL